MDAAGLEIRPIRGIVGEHSFCEVFLDDVRVPVVNRLGRHGEGWAVVREALAFERVGAPRWARASRLLDRVRPVGRSTATASTMPTCNASPVRRGPHARWRVSCTTA